MLTYKKYESTKALEPFSQVPLQPQTPKVVEMNIEDLATIAGGVQDDGSCPPWMCGSNHNETMSNLEAVSQARAGRAVELGEKDLNEIALLKSTGHPKDCLSSKVINDALKYPDFI